MSGEDRLIAWLRDRLGPGNLLGDDTALLPAGGPGDRWVATVDSQIAGVHHPRDLDLALVARRLLAVNLSDLAATGAEPAAALLALAVPARWDHRRFLAAFTAAAGEHGVTLAGGDLARQPGPAVATLTLLGRLPAGRTPLARGAGRAGDALWVGGRLGASAAGRRLLARGARALVVHGAEAAAGAAGPWRLRVELPPAFPPGLADAAHRAVRRHVLPLPQLALGRALAAAATPRGRAGAAIDLSDGLALDLARLCRESGVGALLEARRLPVAAAVPALAVWLGEDPQDLVLAGGEDYALLFTLPPDEAPPPGFGCHRVGALSAEPGLRLHERDGIRPLEPAGWDHLDAG